MRPGASVRLQRAELPGCGLLRHLGHSLGLPAPARHRIVQALFEQMEVLGPNEVWLYASVEAEARGWAAAMSGEFRMEERKTGRGERASASLTQQSLRFLMINRTPRVSLPATERSA